MGDILWMLFWIIAGCIAIALHAPLIVDVILFAIGGVVWIPLDGNLDDWF